MTSSIFEFHWSEAWRWPDDSPLVPKVANFPPILATLPERRAPHDAAPETGEHLIVLIEAGILVAGIGNEDDSQSLVRNRRYMARKSQGRAQIWHTPKGGRMSYGARLRLRESRAFIKDAITELLKIERSHPLISHVWWHCDPRLKGLLRAGDAKLLTRLESNASKLPGPIDIYADDAIKRAWKRICFGRFKVV